MVNAGATFVDQVVCVGGKVITSRRPDDLPAFVAALLNAIKNQEPQGGTKVTK